MKYGFLKTDSKTEVNLFLKKMKDLIKYKKELSKNNPIRFMKEFMTQDEIDGYKIHMAKLRSEYVRSGGYDKKRNRKHIFEIPASVFNANKDYWREIVETRQYNRHPEFLVSNYNTKERDVK